MEESPGGASPRSVPGQQVLANGIVVMVHRNPGAKRVLGERQAGLSVALFKAALVPYIIVFWLICRETELNGVINYTDHKEAVSNIYMDA